MRTLTQFEQVVQEHICLYVYSIRLNKFRIFNDVRLIKNVMFPNKPLYYINYYSANNNTEYTVSSNAGEVLHDSGGMFKLWFTKANNNIGIKSLLDAIDFYTAEKIDEALNVINKMKKQRDLAHAELTSIE